MTPNSGKKRHFFAKVFGAKRPTLLTALDPTMPSSSRNTSRVGLDSASGVTRQSGMLADDNFPVTTGASSRAATPPKNLVTDKCEENITLDVQLDENIVQETTIVQEPSVPGEVAYADNVVDNEITMSTPWGNALDQLRDEQRQILREFGLQNPSTLEVEIGAIRDLRNGTDISALSRGSDDDKKPTLTRARIHSILRKMEKYIIIGDIALQQNPNIVALVWAGVRFCLQVALNDLQTFDGVSSALEDIARMMGSCRTYEDLYLSNARDSGRAVIIQLQKLYVSSLTFMADAIEYFRTGGMQRMAEGITNPFQERFGNLINEINSAMKGLEQRAILASQEYQKDEMLKLGGKLEEFGAGISKLQSGVKGLFVQVVESKRREILKWVSIIDFNAHHEKTRSVRFENTGNWMFGKQAFADWIETDTSSIMWIYGTAGSGKTVLSSLAIDAFTETYKSTPTIFFYCSYGELDRREAASVVATLLKQLSMRSKTMDPQLVAVFDKGISLTMEPSTKLFRAELSRFDETFIVVDALDECSKEERKLLVSFFTGLIRSNPHGIKILLTSRPESDLEQLLKDNGKFLINANDTTKDIRPYVEAVLTDHITNRANLDGEVKAELKQLLVDTISSQADGMFLWAKLQLDHICREPNEESMISQLGKLPLGLDNTYDRMWKEINGPSCTANERKFALRTLKWVLHAKRPLSPQEILEATAVHVESDSSIIPRLTRPASSPDYLIRVCGNFISLDVQTNGFRFIHYSVQEFLNRKKELDDDTLVSTCLTVLGIPNTEQGKECQNIYQYAVHNWEKHCESWSEITNHRASVIERFLLDGAAFAEWHRQRALPQGFQSAGYYRLSSYFNLPVILEHLLLLGQHQSHQLELSASLIIAADRGYPMVADHLLKAGANPNAQGGWCGTPLQAASYRGFSDIVKLLIQAGADVDAIGGYYSSPLNAAIAADSFPVMRQLLDAGANPNLGGGHDGPVLRAAVLKGSAEMVEMLIAAGADLNAQNKNFSSGLYTAARENNTNIVQLLLKAGALVNSRSGKHQGSALYIASGKGLDKMVMVLLAAKADPNMRGGRYSLPLYYAARSGHSTVLKLLLEAGANVNCRLEASYTEAMVEIIHRRPPDALCAAIVRRSVRCVEILIDANSKVQVKNLTYALHLAVWSGYEELVAILLDSGADPNWYLNSDEVLVRFPLDVACQLGFGRIIDRLIGAGADVNESGDGCTALSRAVYEGNETNVAMLLAAGANPNIESWQDLVPLYSAVEKKSAVLVKLLLAAGANVHWTSRDSQHSDNMLFIAVESKQIEIVQMLLEAGVDVDSTSRFGGSAFREAVKGGTVQIVEAMLAASRDTGTIVAWLSAGTEDSLESARHDSALYSAVKNDNIELARVLLEAGANVNCKSGQYGDYAVELATDIAMLELLLTAGADVNCQGGYFGGPMQAGAARGSSELVERLLLAGADVNASGERGSALHLAVHSMATECVKVLLVAGADPNATGGEYGSVLQSAVAATGPVDPGIMEQLLAAGADVNAMGGLYGSALQAAARKQHISAIKLLLSAGADPNARGGYHGSALQAAAACGCEEAVDILLKAGANVNADGNGPKSALRVTSHEGCRALLLAWGAIDVDHIGSDSE